MKRSPFNRKTAGLKAQGRNAGGEKSRGFKAQGDKTTSQIAKAQRAALKALERAQRLAEEAGVKLSDWEGDFLGSVQARVKTFGRAFGDPGKGAPGQALSSLQAVKLKEIAAKAKGDKPRRQPK